MDANLQTQLAMTKFQLDEARRQLERVTEEVSYLEQKAEKLKRCISNSENVNETPVDTRQQLNG